MSSSKGIGNPSAVGVNSADNDGWEEYGKKSKNKNRINASKQVAPQHSSSKPWGHADNVQKPGQRTSVGYIRGPGQTGPAPSSDSRKNAGRGYTVPQSYNRNPESDFAATAPIIPPPLKNGWGWNARTAASRSSNEGVVHHNENAQVVQQADEVDDDDGESDGIEDSDDELLSDGFDSDDSQKSHETRKTNRWFKELFQSLDGLTVDEINEPERQWHCPACQGGPGAIDWYRGLQPLITHAKTKRSKRVRLHRELAEVLDEELKRRGTSAVSAGEMFGKWQGLQQKSDKEIVWPPMVIILNTKLEQDENEKWKGMGNQELLDYFGGYAAMKARHSYGPQGHRGISVLIFEASAVGYAEAERLSKSFEDNCRDRIAWQKNRVPFYSGGQRQLYGYMAEKQDLENFNQHSQGKTKLKYEMRSYQEMVVNQMKQMSEDNQQLIWFKNKVAKEQKSKKALEQSLSEMSEKLRKTLVDNRAVKKRTQKHHEQNKEEMDSQEQFYREQIEQLYEARNEKEEKFGETQVYEREKMTKSEANLSSGEERLNRSEEIAKFIQFQDKEMGEFLKKRDELMEEHDEQKDKLRMAQEKQMMDLKRQHWEAEMALEKQFDEELNKLMEEYTPNK